MSTLKTTVTFLPSWAESEPPPFRICDEDGTHHFNQVQKLALSGRQYLHACNAPSEATAAMLLGTLVHFFVLGPRPGSKAIVCYRGGKRQGKAWDEFQTANADAEIVTATEWERAEVIAAAVKADPVARARLDGARFEVPLKWEEDGGIVCSTSGIDIVSKGAICDLKTTSTTYPDAWRRHALKMNYHCQMAWYRRGARANGIDVSQGLYLLGVETKAPFEVVELELTESLIALADKEIELWLSKLRVYRESNQWPGYAQSPVPLDAPAWMHDDEDADDDEAAA